jgi:hypothetical protein
MLSVMFAQMFDLRGGMLVIDLPVLVTGTTVEAWMLWSFTHVPSFTALEGWLVWMVAVKRNCRAAAESLEECGKIIEVGVEL